MTKETFIIGVSGGCDSMALLHASLSMGNLVVAHVNYHKRETAQRDQEIVEKFCLKHQLKLEVLDAKENKKSNFQAYARDVRYQFFKQLVDKYDAKAIIVAHHMDDVIETYLMQVKRKSIPMYYGIKENTNIDGYLIKRPFINQTKEELEEYCNKHQIEYGVDESNLDKRYTRNKIRLEVVNHLKRQDKEVYVSIIENMNQSLEKQNKKIDELYLEINTEFKIESYLSKSIDIRLEALRKWFVYQIDQSAYRFSIKKLKGIDQWISKKENTVYVYKKIHLYKHENRVYYLDIRESYEYVLSKVEYFKTDYFEITNKGEKIEGITVSKDDFPIKIRNFKQGDAILLRYGTKKVNRWFIDRKIPLKLRKSWPVVVNCNEEVIFVHKIGCNVHHYSNNPNLFVIK